MYLAWPVGASAGGPKPSRSHPSLCVNKAVSATSQVLLAGEEGFVGEGGGTCLLSHLGVGPAESYKSRDCNTGAV